MAWNFNWYQMGICGTDFRWGFRLKWEDYPISLGNRSSFSFGNRSSISFGNRFRMGFRLATEGTWDYGVRIWIWSFNSIWRPIFDSSSFIYRIYRSRRSSSIYIRIHGCCRLLLSLKTIEKGLDRPKPVWNNVHYFSLACSIKVLDRVQFISLFSP